MPEPGSFLGRVTTKQPSLREFVIIYVVLGVSLILEGAYSTGGCNGFLMRRSLWVWC